MLTAAQIMKAQNKPFKIQKSNGSGFCPTMGFWRLIRPKPPWSPVHFICRNTLFCVFADACFVCPDIFATLRALSLTFPKIFRDEAALWECLRLAQRSCEVLRTVGPCGSPVFESAIFTDVNDVSANLSIFAILIVLRPQILIDIHIEVIVLCSYFKYLIQAVPEPSSRKAGIRAVIQSSLATGWRQMTSIAPLKVKTSNFGAFISIIGSIPRHHHNNSPCGSTSISHLADGSVYMDIPPT